jgi:hypothetical protein
MISPCIALYCSSVYVYFWSVSMALFNLSSVLVLPST